MVELPLGVGTELTSFQGQLKALLEAAEEAQPAAPPDYIFSSGGRDFLQRCNNLKTPVTLNLPLSELYSPRIESLMDFAVFRLTILLGELPSGGKEKKTFWSELEKVISEIRKVQAERKTDIPALRLQTSGLSHNQRQLPYLVEEAGRLGIAEVIISPRGTAQSGYLEEALLSARRLGVRLDTGCVHLASPPREDTEVLPYRRPEGADQAPAHSVIASPKGEAIYEELKRLLRHPVGLLAMTGLMRLLPRPSPGQATPDKYIGGPRNDIKNSPSSSFSAIFKESGSEDRTKNMPWKFKDWLKERLIREINPLDFVDPSRLRLTDERRRDCLFPWDWTCITERGEIRPCPASRRVLGDLREKEFPGIWNGSEYLSFRRRLLSPYPLEECRRCSLRGWFNPYQLTDWIWVGMNDRFGVQMGMGWYEREGEAPYRWSRKEANFILKNSGKKNLALVFHLPGKKLTQSGEVWINKEKMGEFSLKKVGDSIFYFPIPPSDNEDLLVELICRQEIIPHRILHNNDRRRLGMAFKGAF